MARVQYGGGVVNFVGSIAGNTFQSNRSGYIVRGRGFTRKTPTLKQNVQTNAHQSILYNWSLLSFANKITWDNLALAHQKETKYGTLKTLSGLNWYEACNTARLQCGLALLDAAPVYSAPAAVPTYTLTCNNTTLTLVIDTPQTITDNYMIIRATPPIRNKTTSFRSQLKYIMNVNSDYWDDVDILSAWETAIGISWPPAGIAGGFQIGVMIQSVDINSGIASAGFLIIEPYS